MSLIDNIVPRRGRPPKVDTSVSPLDAALARTLPNGLDKAIAAIKSAASALKVAEEAHREADDDAVLQTLRAASHAATVAASRAQARRDVADRIGDDDAPSEDKVAALRKAAEDAAADVERHQPRLLALGDEIERRRAKLATAVETADAMLAPWREEVLTAADQQIADAVQAISVAQRTAKFLQIALDSPTHFGVRKVVGEGQHTAADVPAPLAPDIRSAVHVLYVNRHVSTNMLPKNLRNSDPVSEPPPADVTIESDRVALVADEMHDFEAA